MLDSDNSVLWRCWCLEWVARCWDRNRLACALHTCKQQHAASCSACTVCDCLVPHRLGPFWPGAGSVPAAYAEVHLCSARPDGAKAWVRFGSAALQETELQHKPCASLCRPSANVLRCVLCCALQGFAVQSYVTGEGPYANWSKHVADPFGYNLLTVLGAEERTPTL